MILRVLSLLIFTCASLYVSHAHVEQKVQITDTKDQQEKKITEQEVTEEVTEKELLSLLPDDKFLGDPKAPVILIGYFSFSCYHCAMFHKNELAQIKKRYIDTGKLLYIFRNVIIDKFGLKATMLSSCYAEAKDYFSFVSSVFDSVMSLNHLNQDELILLRKIAVLSNLREDMFNKCVENEAIADKVLDAYILANKKLGVDASPTFFIKMNNDAQVEPRSCRYTGHIGLKHLSSIIDKLYEQATATTSIHNNSL